MTAADNGVITATSVGPGRGSHGAPLFWGGPRNVVARHYSMNFGAHYPVAGVSITGATNDFTEVIMVIPDDIPTYLVKPDYTNKKLILYKAYGTAQDDDSDMSAVNAGFLVIGYP